VSFSDTTSMIYVVLGTLLVRSTASRWIAASS
jgi:hypothetical protein